MATDMRINFSWLRIAVATVLLSLGAACDGKSDSRSAEPRAQQRAPGPAPAAARNGDAAAAANPVEPDGDGRATAMRHHVFATPREALEKILAGKPRVIGFGEYHELIGSARVQSTLRRFTEQMLDLLEERASDIVVETWVEAGKCGKKEERVSKDVRKVTERPKHTENELARLIKRAQKIDVRPHILELRCADYDALLDEKDQVDYEKLLLMVTEKLGAKALLALKKSKADRLVALYGGSLHNDLYPYQTVADFSYAKKVDEQSKGGYVEVDLYVPEYVEGDELLTKEDWWPLYQKHSSTEHVVLIERGRGSYILVMKRALKP